MKSDPLLSQLVGSPACAPKCRLEELLPKYQELGFTKFEGFSEWAEARLDWRGDPAVARTHFQKNRISVSSFHLPLIRAGAMEEGLQNALTAARYAGILGARVVLLKAESKELFGKIGRLFLDTLEGEGIKLETAVQNHKGTAISTIGDYQEVFDSVGGDPRLKAVLEVGHFCRVGTGWKEGWDFLGERICLIHVNDIADGKSVLYGSGRVDFSGLVRRIKATAYAGDIVVELELPGNESDTEATFDGLGRAIDLLLQLHSNVGTTET